VHEGFKVGDAVRVIRDKQTFEKGHEEKISKEIYVIVEKIHHRYALQNTKTNKRVNRIYAGWQLVLVPNVEQQIDRPSPPKKPSKYRRDGRKRSKTEIDETDTEDEEEERLQEIVEDMRHENEIDEDDEKQEEISNEQLEIDNIKTKIEGIYEYRHQNPNANVIILQLQLKIQQLIKQQMLNRNPDMTEQQANTQSKNDAENIVNKIKHKIDNTYKKANDKLREERPLPRLENDRMNDEPIISQPTKVRKRKQPQNFGNNQEIPYHIRKQQEKKAKQQKSRPKGKIRRLPRKTTKDKDCNTVVVYEEEERNTGNNLEGQWVPKNEAGTKWYLLVRYNGKLWYEGVYDKEENDIILPPQENDSQVNASSNTKKNNKKKQNKKK
jgi:hypothetical protein